MTFLLDVNVLIALIDPSHVQHDVTHEWFGRNGQAWATCPLTENGVLRIVGNARYRNSPGTPAAVVQSLTSLLALPGHVFWPDDITMLDGAWFDSSRLLSSPQVTDSYLLALACARNGRLATLDRNLVTDAVRGGSQRLHIIR